MKQYEIINLDCSTKKNRKKLLLETMKVTKQEEKPTKQFLEKFSYSVGKKYKMQVQLVKQVGEKLFVSVRYEEGYITFLCHSYYEAICKYILLIYEMQRYKKMKVK